MVMIKAHRNHDVTHHSHDREVAEGRWGTLPLEIYVAYHDRDDDQSGSNGSLKVPIKRNL